MNLFKNAALMQHSWRTHFDITCRYCSYFTASAILFLPCW